MHTASSLRRWILGTRSPLKLLFAQVLKSKNPALLEVRVGALNLIGDKTVLA